MLLCVTACVGRHCVSTCNCSGFSICIQVNWFQSFYLSLTAQVKENNREIILFVPRCDGCLSNVFVPVKCVKNLWRFVGLCLMFHFLKKDAEELSNHNIPAQLSFLLPLKIPLPLSPALLALQHAAVRGDLPLQPHLGVEKLAVALALGGQAAPHLLQLALQPRDHLGEVLQLAGVEPLGVLQGRLQAFLLHTRKQRLMFNFVLQKGDIR